MCEFFRVKLEVDCICKVCEDKCIYCCFLFIIWVKEYFELGKCYYYICLLFNKDVYYYFGDYDQDDNFRGMIIGVWYSVLRLERDDYSGLVYFFENCKYVLDINSIDFQQNYQVLLI